MENKLYLGKVDYNGHGRKNCKAFITWELTEEGNFSMQAEIWNPRETDIYCGGQCVEEVAKFRPTPKVKRMVAIWKRYHLNDLKAGTPAQEFAIDDWQKHNGNKYDYTLACEYLQSIGLFTVPDPRNYLKCYRYGHAWLKEEIPEAIKNEIRS